MAIGHLITCQHQMAGEVLFYTCGRAQKRLMFLRGCVLPRRKYSVSNPLHQLLSQPPGLSVRVVLGGWQFSSAPHPAQSREHGPGVRTAHKSGASSPCSLQHRRGLMDCLWCTQ